MKKIADFSEVSPLILKYFKRGVITNNFLIPADYKSEIAEGNLFFEEAGENLYLFIKRDGFWLCFFYIINAESPFPEVDEKVITEVGERAIEIVERNGFLKLMERIQLKLVAPQGEKVCSAQKADKCCAEEVYGILNSSFNSLTGNLPSLVGIENECEKGEIFVIKKDGECAGVLRSETGEKSAKIKHLAVKSEYRGEGLARKLTETFLAENAGKRCSVWTGCDNEPAKALYKSLGFLEDTERTSVYEKGR